MRSALCYLWGEDMKLKSKLGSHCFLNKDGSRPVGEEFHNEIYDLVGRLIPSTKEIGWDIEMIADIRDTIQHWLVDKYKIVDELEFYP